MLELSFAQLPFHHLGYVIPQVLGLHYSKYVEELLHLQGQFTPFSLIKSFALGLPLLCRENLIPQIVERVLVKEKILVHSPTDPHLQDGGDVD